MFSGDNIGDICEDDMDGDGVFNNDDHCPRNPKIQGTDFHNYTVVDLYPGGDQSKWLLFDNGAEIRQVAEVDRPVMLIGKCVHDSHLCVSVFLIGKHFSYWICHNYQTLLLDIGGVYLSINMSVVFELKEHFVFPRSNCIRRSQLLRHVVC